MKNKKLKKFCWQLLDYCTNLRNKATKELMEEGFDKSELDELNLYRLIDLLKTRRRIKKII